MSWVWKFASVIRRNGTGMSHVVLLSFGAGFDRLDISSALLKVQPKLLHTIRCASVLVFYQPD